MKIEFYIKETESKISGMYFVDDMGDVYEFDCGELSYCGSIGWRVVE